jgi:hypothetical protein
MVPLTSKQLGDDGEDYTLRLLNSRGYTAKKLPINAKTYDLLVEREGRTFFVSVKVSRDKQHVRLGARRSVLGLEAGNFVFAYVPALGGEISSLATSPYSLLILPGELAKTDALTVHDQYWAQKAKVNGARFSGRTS